MTEVELTDLLGGRCRWRSSLHDWLFDKAHNSFIAFIERLERAPLGIIVPFWFYLVLSHEARRTDFGRFFSSGGLTLYQIPVFCGWFRHKLK